MADIYLICSKSAGIKIKSKSKVFILYLEKNLYYQI